MDYTVLIAIIIVAAIFSLVWLSMFLRKRNIVTGEDLLVASKLLGLSISIIDDLNLQNEAKIKQISIIVTDAIEYVVENMKENTDKIEAAYLYALKLCQDAKLNMTDERKIIIRQLIELGFKNVK